MIQDEIKQMIQKTSKDKIAIHKLSTKGYVSYSKNTNYIGAIATVNSQNNALVSYLQDINDDTQVVATVCFENGGTLVYGLFGERYFLRQVGKNILNMNGTYTSRVYSPDINGIKQDINSIRLRCSESSEQKLPLIDLLISKSGFSKEQIRGLLNTTLNELNNASFIKKQPKDISPKVKVSPILSQNNDVESDPKIDNIHEI